MSQQRLSHVGKSSRRIVSDAAFEALEQRRMMSASPWYVYGTDGADVITLSNVPRAVVVTVNGQTMMKNPLDVSTIIVDAMAGYDVIDASGIVSMPLTLSGGGHSDTITGGGGNDVIIGAYKFNGLPTNGDYYGDVLKGGGGNDQIIAGKYANSTLWGEAGNDTLYGSDGGDQLDGGAGMDYLNGGAGNDWLGGGVDNDTVWAGEGDDTVFAGAGDDKVYGVGGNDLVYAEEGNDSISGGDGNDVLCGQYGNDTISGDGGADYMTGNEGWDRCTYENRFDDLVLSLDGIANDGAPNEGDNIETSFEAISGGDGNDFITGNAGNNFLFGGFGNDTIHAGDGADSIFGESGNDQLYGDDGYDAIWGDGGNDRLYGGHDNDKLDGGDGDDDLIALGGGFDTVSGGSSLFDVLWIGDEDTYSASANVINSHGVHVISNFANTEPTEPDGQDLEDPSVGSVKPKTHWSWQGQFSDIPLFGNDGKPMRNDVDQNQLGDCYYLAPISGIAEANPNIIRRAITDLGDGTYAVRFWRSGVEKFYRVDDQIPLIWANGVERAAFAGLGQSGNNSMWVPMMEKAWALCRKAAQSYESIEGDYNIFTPGTPWETYDLFAMPHSTDSVVFTAKDTYMQKMRNYLMAGGVVCASTHLVGTSLATGHVYNVVDVSSDLKSVTLRNPWATDDDGFQWGANDGYIHISVDTFDSNMQFVSCATF